MPGAGEGCKGRVRLLEIRKKLVGGSQREESLRSLDLPWICCVVLGKSVPSLNLSFPVCKMQKVLGPSMGCYTAVDRQNSLS